MRLIGDEFEQRACDFLRAEGMTIVAQNFAAKTGEIDIIALDQGYLVFLEVRARSSRRFVSAAGSVDKRKQQRILRTAQFFLQCHRRWTNFPCRFDVIAFDTPQSCPDQQLNWIRAAFTA